MTRSQILLAIAIADVLIFGGLIGREVMARERGHVVKLPVRGYDPRDLISGHYIRFRLVAVGEADELSADADEFCLEERDGRHHIDSVHYSAGDCDIFIRRVDPTFGVDRFYLDERKAKDLAWIPASADAYVTATVSRDGGIHVTDLVIDGKSVSD
jgi:uncharacterized membrane-anchored protein